MTAISVIIPVYNVGTYVSACIESLKQQRFRDLEFIFIDDCSTDGSMTYIEEFANSDSRVRILRCTENSGSGPARNLGIEAARGAYLSFIDPDDRIAPDFFERLYTIAVSGDFDIIKGKRIKVDLKSGNFYTEKLNRKIRKGLEQGISLFLLFTWQHMTAIYKKGLFEDKKVRYGTSRNSQDTTFLLIVCKKARNIIFDDDAVYYYYTRPGSQTSAFTENRCRYELDSLQEKIDFLLRGNMDGYDHQYLTNNFFLNISNICHAKSEGLLPVNVEEKFTNILQKQILRIPDWSQIIKDNSELKILMYYRKLIPVYNFNRTQFHYDRIQRWVDFLLEHPEIDEKKIYVSFVFAIFHAFLSLMKHSPGSLMSGSQYLVYIREQIGKLSEKQKKLIIRSILFAQSKMIKYIYKKIRSDGF